MSGFSPKSCQSQVLKSIGDLSTRLSDGRCHFVMAKEKRWGWIEDLLR